MSLATLAQIRVASTLGAQPLVSRAAALSTASAQRSPQLHDVPPPSREKASHREQLAREYAKQLIAAAQGGQLQGDMGKSHEQGYDRADHK
mmetsp:Transcript_21302/g.71651  ORF Transcript_21302/g.71651 Transcript_21302/m.71651 type:complete len:91 (-) Transcript_21302:732-1004(-)